MSENLSLYTIKEEYKDLINQVDEQLFTTGEVDPELEKALAINQTQLIEKVENYKYILDTIDSRKGMAEREIDRVKKFKERQDAVANRLKYYLLQALLEYGDEDSKGVKSLEVGTMRLSTRKSKAVEVTDMESVPLEYRQVTVKMSSAVWNVLRDSLSPAQADLVYSISEDIRKAEIKKIGGVEGTEIEERVNLTIK